MTFIWALKRKSGAIYYYLRRTERIDGKVKVVLNKYLGTADEILERMKQGAVADDFELVSFRFGTIAAIADVDSELQFMETVRQGAGSAATAKAIFAYLCRRSEEPLSKNGMGDGPAVHH